MAKGVSIVAYFNPELQKQMRLQGFKVKLIERLCAYPEKLNKLTEVLNDFNIPFSRYTN